MPEYTPEQQAAFETAAARAAELVRNNACLPPDEPMELEAEAAYRLADLWEWQRRIADVQNALLPPNTSRPNPLLLGDLVIASVFSSPESKGQIRALDRHTGNERWRIPLPYLASSHVYAAEGRLFGGTSQALLSIDPANGQVEWKFVPYRGGSERLYSAPVCRESRLFVGDRRGVFHCLAADSGKPIWSVQTTTVRNRDVNTTALLYEDLAITATSAKLALAYEQATGAEVWRQTLPGCCGEEIRMFGDMAVLSAGEYVLGLSPRSGEILHRWHWKDRDIIGVAPAGETLCVAIEIDPFDRERRKLLTPGTPQSELLGLSGDTVHWRLPYPRYACPSLRYDALTCRVYEATQHGLGIVDPAAGVRRAAIGDFGTEYSGPINRVGLPSTDGEALYVLSEAGLMARLAYPIVKKH